jgi:hypothetical protein
MLVKYTEDIQLHTEEKMSVVQLMSTIFIAKVVPQSVPYGWWKGSGAGRRTYLVYCSDSGRAGEADDETSYYLTSDSVLVFRLNI